jgi:hypothetical protein
MSAQLMDVKSAQSQSLALVTTTATTTEPLSTGMISDSLSLSGQK